MRKTTDLQPVPEPKPANSRKEQLQKLWSRFCFIAAVTSPFWFLAVLIQGSLSARLLGAAILLLIPIAALISLRWVFYAAGLLLALRQRREELQKGELDDAKKY